jgi:hypothetical protein
MDSNLRFPDRSAPVFETASPVLHLGLAVSRPGTESSNPSPSRRESTANLALAVPRVVSRVFQSLPTTHVVFWKINCPLRNHLVPNGDGTADGVGAYSTPTLPPETMPGDCLPSVCALAAGAGSIGGLAGGELGSAIGEAP